MNPLSIEPIFAENPIVTRLEDGMYMAVYDADNDPNAVGYTWSTDGIHWAPGASLVLQSNGPGRWAKELTTPLGLIPEGNNTFTLFYTGRMKPNLIYSESVGFVTLKLTYQSAKK